MNKLKAIALAEGIQFQEFPTTTAGFFAYDTKQINSVP